MKTLYLDLFSGVSGDMFVGALLDLGVELDYLERGLSTLGLRGFHVHASKQQRHQITGTKFDVHVAGASSADRPPDHEHSHAHAHAHDHSHDHEPHAALGHAHTHDAHGHHAHSGQRDHAAIVGLIRSSSLSPWVKEKALSVFSRIAVAEGKIHGIAPERVHFHEVGAIDSIVDIVGGCLALERLGHPAVQIGLPTDGSGFVDCAHGRFPVPAPATLEILSQRGFPLTQCEEPAELITPTGAALVAEFAESCGPIRQFRIEKIGYGLGTRRLRSRPNVLRALWGEASAAGRSEPGWETDEVMVLETNLDDTTAEQVAYVMEMALTRGALDAFCAPLQMKKSRPGTLVSLIVPTDLADPLAELLLRETSAFGVRRYLTERRKLRREVRSVATAFGDVDVKFGYLGEETVQASPEYESCKAVAARTAQPLRAIYEAAVTAARRATPAA